MKHLLSVIAGLLVLATGCARFNSTVTERTLADGSVERVTRVTASTLFDSKSELAKMSSGQTDKSQKYPSARSPRKAAPQTS